MVTEGANWESRLAAAGVDPADEPLSIWQRLRVVEGDFATIADLYELAARQQGMTASELPVAERHALGRAAMAELWPEHEVTAGSARPPSELITLVPYDAGWPSRFALWQQRILAALAPLAPRVEHVGSTSVPGLTAKPVVDIQVSVPALDDEDAYVPALAEIGLQLRSRDEFHRYFRQFPDQPREVHVHVCQVGSKWEDDHLTFRDYLRTHPEAAAAYVTAKLAAVHQWADDSYAYTDAKTAVILDILARARRSLD